MLRVQHKPEFQSWKLAPARLNATQAPWLLGFEPHEISIFIAEALPGLRARKLGAACPVRDRVLTVGSFVGAWLQNIGPQANFIGGAICGRVGVVWYWFSIGGRWLNGIMQGQQRGIGDGKTEQGILAMFAQPVRK